jgi:predicted CoA-substrate-specific enzyme activase
MIAVGVDVGSLLTKLVVLDDDRPDLVVASRVLPTTGSIGRELDAAIEALLRQAMVPRARIGSIGATGRFGDQVPCAAFIEDEARCVAAAVATALPGVEVALHLGAQASTAVAFDPAGELVRVVGNDKCAAGTGRFLESIARKLGLEPDELDAVAAGAEAPTPITSQCAVYAESEVISRVNQGAARADVLAGVCGAVGRMAVTLGRRLGHVAGAPYTLTGGVARFAAVVSPVEAGLDARRWVFPHDPALAPAMGAALLEDAHGEP